MNDMPTNAELTFWVVLLVIMVVVLIALPIINRVMECKSYEEKYGFTEYHDDMEDCV